MDFLYAADCASAKRNYNILIHSRNCAIYKNPYFKYIQGGKTIPLPLKIVKHYGNGTITNRYRNIRIIKNGGIVLGYIQTPCTIESSNEIAQVWLLSQYEGSVYDYRYFM